MTVPDAAAELSSDGFVRIDGPFPHSDEAFDLAGALVEVCRVKGACFRCQ